MGFKIGNVQINNKLVLAPMAGISNHPFRVICKSFGVGLMFSEMISDKGLHYNNQKTKSLLYMTDDERPVAIQIFGSDINTMVEAAKYLDQNSNCDIIDINMGCPVPKVAISAQAGAALMKDPNKIYEIVKAVVAMVSKPITVKIRTGWDANSINCVEVAKVIERAGASAITIHGRNRAQGYSGKADLNLIKAVKEAVKIPVIGNGDVTDYDSYKMMLEYTKVDAVMIGRAALGNPWVFREIIEQEQGLPITGKTLDDILRLLSEHFNNLLELKGEHLACLEIRSQGPWYLKGIPYASSIKSRLSRVSSASEFTELLDEIYESL